MSAPDRVAQAAKTIRARWERRVSTDPQTEAAQALEDTGQLLDPEVAAELVAFRKARELAAAVAKYGAFPVPVGAAPHASERDRLRAAYVEALGEAHRTHPCPVTGRPYWTGCVHYDEAGHVSGVGSCHSERRADAVLAVRDVELDRLRAQVAALLEERRETNEALDDVVRELRARPSCPCPSADQPGPHQVGCFFDGVPVSPPSERPVDGLTATFAPVASYREDPHDSPLHHDWRIGRDLPELGGES